MFWNMIEFEIFFKDLVGCAVACAHVVTLVPGIKQCEFMQFGGGNIINYIKHLEQSNAIYDKNHLKR